MKIKRNVAARWRRGVIMSGVMAKINQYQQQQRQYHHRNGSVKASAMAKWLKESVIEAYLNQRK